MAGAALPHSLAAHVWPDELVDHDALAWDALLAQRTDQAAALVHAKHGGNGGNDELQAAGTREWLES